MTSCLLLMVSLREKDARGGRYSNSIPFFLPPVSYVLLNGRGEAVFFFFGLSRVCLLFVRSGVGRREERRCILFFFVVGYLLAPTLVVWEGGGQGFFVGVSFSYGGEWRERFCFCLATFRLHTTHNPAPHT